MLARALLRVHYIFSYTSAMVSLVMFKSVVFLLSYLIAVTSTNTCNYNVKMKQTLRNEGFHRNITYEIFFNNDDDVEPLSFRDCVVGLDQTLPCGVYANADELGDLKRARKIEVIPKNRINIELPAEQSSSSNLYIMGPATGDHVSLWVPVHARYHQARPGGGMARNEISPPRLYVRCPDARLRCPGVSVAMPYLCNGSSRDCWKSYNEIPYTMMTDTLIWEVPVGNTDHYHAVAGGTALVVVAGSLYLLKTVHQYKLRKWQ